MIASRTQTVFVLAAVLVLAGTSWAQSSRSSSNSMFGSRTLGSGIGGASRTAFGGSPGSRVEQAQSGAGEVTGNERFVRGNRDATQFVGADTRDTSTTIFGNMANGGNAGLGGAGGLQGLQGLNNLVNRNRNAGQNRPGGNQSDRGKANYSIGMEVGFDYPAPDGNTLGSRIEERLARMSQIRGVEPLKVDLEGRTATIRGVVATAHGRDLAVRMVLLEPGISEVRNLVTVWEPTPPSSSDTAPGATPPTDLPTPTPPVVPSNAVPPTS